MRHVLQQPQKLLHRAAFILFACAVLLTACDDPESAPAIESNQIDLDAETAELEKTVESVRAEADRRTESSDADGDSSTE